MQVHGSAEAVVRLLRLNEKLATTRDESLNVDAYVESERHRRDSMRGIILE